MIFIKKNMGKHIPEVDAYIAKAQPFAQPILEYLRSLAHEAVPGTEEKIKWGFPHFDDEGPLCHMAAFKQHCAFGFWKASLMNDPDQILTTTEKESMGHVGRITSLKDLPPKKILIKYIKEAYRLNKEGIKAVKKMPAVKKELVVPEDLANALAKNKKAKITFDAFSPSHRKEYIEWITEAKREETRNKRINETLSMLSEGKSRHWKHQP